MKTYRTASNDSNVAALTINAVIADNGGASALTVGGDGTVTLNGINTYTGATIVGGGTLNLNESLSLSSGLIFGADATVNLASGKDLGCAVTTDEDGMGILNFLGGTQTAGGDIGAAGLALEKVNVASGTTAFSGDIYATTLSFSGDGTANIAVDKSVSGAVDNLTGSDGAGTLGLLGGDQTVGGNVGATNTLKAVTIAAALTKTAEFNGTVEAATITMSGAGKAQFDDAVTAMALNVTSSGEVEINADSTVTTTTVATGTLDLNATFTGTTITFTGDGAAVVADAKNITANITNTAGIANRGNLTTEGDAVITGTIGGAGAQRFGSLNITGIAGTTARITGAVYATDATIGAGTLQLDSNADITTTTLSDAGTLALDATLTGAVDNGGNLLTVSNTGTGQIDGVISGTGALTKTGTGTLTLSGVNTYEGGTNINAGVVSATTSAAALGTGAVVVTDDAALQITGALTFDEALTINGSGVSGGGALRHISGGATYSGVITLGMASRINSDADTLTLSGATIDEAYDLTIGGAGNTTISKIIATGDNTLIKDGTGTLTLSGANTYSGGTEIGAGVVSATTSAEALGTGAVLVADGAALQITGALDFNEALTISGTGVSSGGALRHISGNTTYSGDITLGAASRINSDADTLTLSGATINDAYDLTIGGAADTHISGIIAIGTGALTKDGAGKLTLSGANTYTGTTTISAGTLQIGNNGTTGSLSSSSPITNNGTLLFYRTDTITQGTDFASVISGTGAVTQAGAGTLILNGANTYTGVTSVNAGVLNLRHDTATGTTVGGVTVTGGAALQLQNDISVGVEALILNGTGISSDGAMRNISGNNSWAGAITLGSTTRVNSDTGTLTLSGNIGGAGQNLRIGGDGNTAISGAIGTTTGTLLKDGDGTLTLSGGNAYSGGTTITAGVVSATTSAEALGTGDVAVADGAALQITGALNFNEALTISGTGVSSGGALRHISGNATYSGDITLGAASRINSDADTFTLSGAALDDAFGLTVGGAGDTVISKAITTGANTLTKDGTGTLTLSGTNTYTGVTTVAEGVLELDFSAAGTATNIINTGSALELSGGELLLTGKDSTVNSQTVNGLTLDSGRSEITLAANGATSLVLNLGNIINSAGATINFTLPTGAQGAANGIRTTRANEASGILGAWATVTTATGTELAVSGGDGTNPGNITAYAGYTDINVYGGVILDLSNNNVRIKNGGVTGDITLEDSETAISTLMQNSDFVGTVDVSGGVLRTNGIIISAGAENLVIGDTFSDVGTLTVATGGGNLFLTVNNPDSILTVNSVIADYVSASSLTKSGAGTLDLNAVNTYTGSTTIGEGTLSLGESLTASSGLIFSGDATVNLASGKTLGCGVTTEDDDSGTLNFLGGTQSVTGNIGAAGKALKKVDVESGTVNFNGHVTATTLNLGTNSTAVIASGKNLTGEVTAFHGKGTLTLAGGDQTMTGDIGTASQSWLGTLTVEGSGTATFDGAIMTKYFDVTDDRTVVFNDDVQTLNDFTLSSDSVVTLADTKNMTLGSGGIAGSSGQGTLTLLGTHTITGNVGSTLLGNNGLKLLTVGDVAGSGSKTVTVNGDIRAVTVNFAKDNELKLGSGYGLTGAVTTTTDGTGTLTFLGDAGSVGTIGAAGKVLKAVNFSGSATLSNDIYATDTNVTSGATVTPGGGDINGNLSLLAGGTLSLGSNLMQVVGGAFSSAATSGINVSISSGASGKLEATGAAASVAAGTNLFINVIGHIPENNQFTLLDGGTGGGVETLTSITDDSARFYFTQVVDDNDLILLSHRYTTFAAAGASMGPNARAVGAVLDAIDEAGTTGDMLTVIDTLDTLSDAQIGNALNAMYPDMSSGAMQASQQTASQFLGTVSSRLGYARSGMIGLATGDMIQGMGFWMQALGSNMHQGSRNGIEGYNANLFGTSMGADKLIDDHYRVGLSGGYGFANVNSKTPGSPSDSINSFHGTIYGSYDSINLAEQSENQKGSKGGFRNRKENSWYADGMFGFTQNNYDSRREIWLTPSSARVAKADHYGQQYSTKLETGYTFVFDFTKALETTPFASLEYSYLRMNKYKEKGANSLDLTVDGEGYNQLLQVLGMKFAYPFVSKKAGTFIPALKAAWLYDYIGDQFETTANFAGGGSSFTTKGAKPARNGMLLGAELAFLNKGNMTLTANYDLELKEAYTSNTYYATARFDF